MPVFSIFISLISVRSDLLCSLKSLLHHSVSFRFCFNSFPSPSLSNLFRSHSLDSHCLHDVRQNVLRDADAPIGTFVLVPLSAPSEWKQSTSEDLISSNCVSSNAPKCLLNCKSIVDLPSISRKCLRLSEANSSPSPFIRLETS